MSEQSLPESGVLRVRITEDFELDGGVWKAAGEQEGWLIARITPPTTPMFQQVVEYLETKPVPPGGNTRRADEARAAVAVCLRWGSYFAVLADPSRPDAPNIDDEQVGQIDDEEMARMNIEISAALAWWLTLSGADERRYWDSRSPGAGLPAHWPQDRRPARSRRHAAGVHDARDGGSCPPWLACGPAGTGPGDGREPRDSRHRQHDHPPRLAQRSHSRTSTPGSSRATAWIGGGCSRRPRRRSFVTPRADSQPG